MKKRMPYITTIVGLLILAAGMVMIKMVSDPQGILLTLPYVCVGVGCGLFGQGAGELISQRMMKKHPDTARMMEIEKNDERNKAIGYRAKAKAYDCMVFVFGALILSFALMQMDLTAVLLSVFAYLFVIGCGVYYRIKYDKEM